MKAPELGLGIFCFQSETCFENGIQELMEQGILS